MWSFLRWARSLPHVLRGASALREKNHERVVECYTRAFEIWEDIEYLHLRAHAYCQLGKTGLAVADLTRIIEIDANDRHAYFLRADLNRERGFFPQALADYDYLIENSEGMVLAYVCRAYCLMDAEKFREALDDCKTALELEPHNKFALDIQAWCIQCVKKGEDEKMEEKAGGERGAN